MNSSLPPLLLHINSQKLAILDKKIQHPRGQAYRPLSVANAKSTVDDYDIRLRHVFTASVPPPYTKPSTNRKKLPHKKKTAIHPYTAASHSTAQTPRFVQRSSPPVQTKTSSPKHGTAQRRTLKLANALLGPPAWHRPSHAVLLQANCLATVASVCPEGKKISHVPRKTTVAFPHQTMSRGSGAGERLNTSGRFVTRV